MQLFRNHLHAFCAFMAAHIILSNAQLIFYPALKVNQISVRANGRLNAVSTVALAAPLLATRDAQGRRIVQRQTVGRQQVGVQQSQPVGGQPLQPIKGPELQQVEVPQFQQFGGQKVPRGRANGAPPPNFRGQQWQRVEGIGSQPSIFQGQRQQQQRVSLQQYQQFQAQQQQFSGQEVHQVRMQHYDWPVQSSPQINFNTANWHQYGWQPTNWHHVGK
nr:uncharacterized protein LOC106620124 [Bactrocera oleae]